MSHERARSSDSYDLKGISEGRYAAAVNSRRHLQPSIISPPASDHSTFAQAVSNLAKSQVTPLQRREIVGFLIQWNSGQSSDEMVVKQRAIIENHHRTLNRDIITATQNKRYLNEFARCFWKLIVADHANSHEGIDVIDNSESIKYWGDPIACQEAVEYFRLEDGLTLEDFISKLTQFVLPELCLNSDHFTKRAEAFYQNMAQIRELRSSDPAAYRDFLKDDLEAITYLHDFIGSDATHDLPNLEEQTQSTGSTLEKLIKRMDRLLSPSSDRYQ